MLSEVECKIAFVMNPVVLVVTTRMFMASKTMTSKTTCMIYLVLSLS